MPIKTKFKICYALLNRKIYKLLQAKMKEFTNKYNNKCTLTQFRKEKSKIVSPSL